MGSPGPCFARGSAQGVWRRERFGRRFFLINLLCLHLVADAEENTPREWYLQGLAQVIPLLAPR